MIETKKTFDLNTHTARLLMQEPFFASLSRRVTKAASTAIPTAGVRVNPDTTRFEMLYNREFFEKLADKERTAVLIHEFYHLIFDHVTSRKPEGVNHRDWNLACDLAINSHISGLPDMACVPGKGPFADFKAYLSAEAYLPMIQEKREEEKEKSEGEGKGKGQNGEGSGDGEPGEGDGSGSGMPDDSFDSHEGWGEADSDANDMAKERIKDYLREAVKDAQEANSWGSVSHECRKLVMDSITTTVDWVKVLRYFVKTSTRANKRSTVKRVNKRYRYIHPGKKVTRQARIAISVDQSGSVSDAMLGAFFNELNKLAKLATFTVIPFDTTVDPSLVYEWKKGENRKRERVMCGGTCFDAPTEYVNSKGFDGHIVLTDMCAPKPKASKCQRMWMTTEYYARRPYFKTNERVIAIKCDG